MACSDAPTDISNDKALGGGLRAAAHSSATFDTDMFKRTRDILLNVTTAIITVLAVVMAIRAFNARSNQSHGLETRAIRNGAIYGTHGHLVGDTTAPVRVVEFFDYRCPFCRRADAAIDTLLRRYDGKVAFVYRHFPIHEQSGAIDAAVASECAGRQGHFFFMHRYLLNYSGAYDEEPWQTHAANAGMKDLAAFEACMTDSSARSAILRDVSVAQSLGIESTPTFIIGDSSVRS